MANVRRRENVVAFERHGPTYGEKKGLRVTADYRRSNEERSPSTAVGSAAAE
jgi:hypothetical protein